MAVCLQGAVQVEDMDSARGWLAGVREENRELDAENVELRRLVEEARHLLRRVESARGSSRPGSVVAGGEAAGGEEGEDALRHDHAELSRRASLCTKSRPQSAASTPCGVSIRSAGSLLRNGYNTAAAPAAASPVAAGAALPVAAAAALPVAPARADEGAGHRFKVSLDRSSGEGLGIRIRAAGGGSLEVSCVKDDGLVPAWNASNPSLRIKEGDRILEVNGVSGSPDRLSAECKREIPLALTVLRRESPC
eukprot:TRINITY_DN16308_c0_g1_i1.p2 TRINITY_DN16308_c0_g1~~TRINITY_DN16308_c0_g1_i1.p2  ORF type:complete len:251 (+),score=67.25 TRINITY_DN16308_c0_g1_i1:107-859(+)